MMKKLIFTLIIGLVAFAATAQRIYTVDADTVQGYPNDTLTITDGGTQAFIINGSPFKHYRSKIVGEVDDTAYVQMNYKLTK